MSVGAAFLPPVAPTNPKGTNPWPSATNAAPKKARAALRTSLLGICVGFGVSALVIALAFYFN